MSRGQLNWRITIPPDGSLPFQGVAPDSEFNGLPALILPAGWRIRAVLSWD